MSKEKIVQLQDKDGNIVYPKLKHNNYTDEDKKQTWLNQGSISAKEDTGEVSTEHRSQVNVSFESVASESNSQVNASDSSTADGYISQINASGKSKTSGRFSQVNASTNSEASSTKSQVNVGEDSVASGNKSQINASSKSKASGTLSQVNASTDSEANNTRSQINASEGSISSGYKSQVNVSSKSEASGSHSQVNSSGDSKASGTKSQINASESCFVDGSNWTNYGGNVIISGKSVKIDDSCGYGVVAGGSGTGVPSTQNRKWQLDGKGTIKASGSITGNSSFADFAEYMESEDGKAIPLGTMVTMGKGQFIKAAQEGDFPVGIISATAGLVLNAQGFEHKHRFLYDRYGQPIYVKKYSPVLQNGDILTAYSKGDPNLPKIGDVIYTELDEDGNKKDIKVVDYQEIEVQQLNPDWDETQEYIPREDRDEWNVVGMKGQIYVNIDETVKEGDFIQAGKDGVATKGNAFNRNWLVMEVTTPYSGKIGMGIARVII